VFEITSAQGRALDFVRAAAQGARSEAVERIGARLGGRVEELAPSLVAAVAWRGRVALHFHPDRLLADGSTVAEGLLRDGRYRSQFETGISNGGLTAVPGGERDRWERRLFGGAYSEPGVQARERPKYGALDLFRHPDGPAPRFGSCYLVLGRPVLERCTFACGDSVLEPSDVGTLDTLEPVVAGLVEAVVARDWLLGRPSLDPEALVSALLAPLDPALESPEPRVGGRPGRSLDEYVEVQVHGDVRLDTDLDALVADPSFRNGPVGGALAELAGRCRIPLLWHPGFRLAADQVPDDFRGPVMPGLARRVQREFALPGRLLDVELIGRAAASVNREPHRWAGLGDQAEVLQYLKQLWHVLVRCG
jgi:Protein of unknown function (DUF3626)